MAKILRLDEIMHAARTLGVEPSLIEAVEAVGSALAAQVANALDCEVGPLEDGDGGLMASFYAVEKDQACPPLLDELDEGGEWEMATWADAAPEAEIVEKADS